MPPLGLGVWLQVLPLLAMFCTLWITAQDELSLKYSTVKFWEYVLYGWAYAVTGYWLGLVICIRYLRARWLAALFAWFYLFLYAVNISLLHSAGVVLDAYYFRIAGTTNWMAYFTSWIWAVTGLYGLSGIAASWLLYKFSPALKQVHVRSLLVLLVLLWGAVQISKNNYLHPSALVTKMVGSRQSGAWQVTQTETLRTVADNPVAILDKVVFAKWQPLQIRPTSELSAVADTLKTWHLTLGARQYPSLGLKPFNHIIVFTAEGLSLDLLSPFNTNLPPEITPFYGSTMVTQAMLVNYKTVGIPTQPGLIATYNSHPNVPGLLTGNSEMSLIKLLNAQGYETYVLTGCSETFLNNKTFYTKLGFKHIIGTETWGKDPKKLPFIDGRGLMDRELYNAALEILAQNPDKKIYIHVHNLDIHGPVPRDYFGALEYPPVPERVEQAALGSDATAKAILEGVFRHDYDMGLVLRKMQDRNLLTDDTLMVLMADHNFPPTKALKDIPGYPDGIFERIPLAFFSGQKLPKMDPAQSCSQIDFAPSVAHLLGLPIPPGWWGESVFATNTTSPYVLRFNDLISFTTAPGTPEQKISITHPANQSESNLMKVFQSIYFDPARTNH